MQESNPWEFGWTQLLTVIGLSVTITIAFATFRTFQRARRERVEEKRIDIAIEVLALAHESKFVFDAIRSDLSFGYEWADMPTTFEANEQPRHARGPFYATLKRIEANKDFFDRVWRMQVLCTAVFGRQHEATFLKMHQARRNIEVAAEMLMQDPEPSAQEKDLWKQLRSDVWAARAKFQKNDRVGKMLDEFMTEIEALCRPVVEHKYKLSWMPVTQRPFVQRIQKWLCDLKGEGLKR